MLPGIAAIAAVPDGVELPSLTDGFTGTVPVKGSASNYGRGAFGRKFFEDNTVAPA